FYYFCTDMLSLVLSVGIEIGIFVYIIYAMLHGNISKTELVLYVFTVTEFAAFVTETGNVLVGSVQINMEIGNMREFLDIKNTARNSGGQPLPTEQPYAIELKNVSFTYPESEKQVLKNINLKLQKGEKLALVGVNGAGKTTLVKILCGLYRPTEGEVLLNGTDIREFNRDEYYKGISAVFQDPKFLPCTVLENVSMLPGNESDRDKFFTCVRKAGLYDKIQALPQKEDTPLIKTVHENAVELSGGEAQRLLLARAMYKDAPILILDEPTAALDPIAENEIYLRYSEISQNRTSVYISHRVSSTRFCDRIVLLDENEIAEVGTHDALMRLGGKYAEMYRIQSKYYRQEAVENDG
ncbi:MAG: ABC transporter ATP-binding protein, partial [Acutalibacteraceae bacterium]